MKWLIVAGAVVFVGGLIFLFRKNIGAFFRFLISPLFLINFVLAITVAFLINYCSIKSLDDYTNHGVKVEVPYLIGTNVAELDESEAAAESASLRERLELHRSNPECASCHSQMDPLGFALENYDAVGRWRTNDGEYEIDASGELTGGHQFEDAKELKELLQSTATKKFTRCLIENMLVYALGRGLEPTDFCTVESIRQRLAADDYRIQSIIFGILESDAFQYRGVNK